MQKFERKINGLILGSTFPLLLGLIFVITWYYIDGVESRAAIYLAVGVLLGLLIDFRYLKSWINNRFELPVWFIAAIYISYNIFVFGFFMGLPVFNVFLGFFAGYYYGNRISFNNVESGKYSKYINQVALFTGLIMASICVLSGYLALVNNEAAGMIKEVLGLSFEVTKAMVWGVVLIGGLALILINFLLTKITMIKTIQHRAAA